MASILIDPWLIVPFLPKQHSIPDTVRSPCLWNWRQTDCRKVISNSDRKKFHFESLLAQGNFVANIACEQNVLFAKHKFRPKQLLIKNEISRIGSSCNSKATQIGFSLPLPLPTNSADSIQMRQQTRLALGQSVDLPISVSHRHKADTCFQGAPLHPCTPQMQFQCTLVARWHVTAFV